MDKPSPQGQEDARLREAAQRLADTIAPYRVLGRDELARLSGAADWPDVTFVEALHWAVDHGVLRRLDTDFYETTRP